MKKEQDKPKRKQGNFRIGTFTFIIGTLAMMAGGFYLSNLLTPRWYTSINGLIGLDLEQWNLPPQKDDSQPEKPHGIQMQ